MKNGKEEVNGSVLVKTGYTRVWPGIWIPEDLHKECTQGVKTLLGFEP